MDEQCTPEAHRPQPHELGARRGEKPTTLEQAALIALSEYGYWRDQEREDHSIGGMAAAANIYTAIAMGVMAPWHPGYPKEEKKE